MGKKDSQNSNKKDFLERDIDPAIVSKVDKMMSEEPRASKNSPQPAEPANEVKAAPLLPSDKLPQPLRKLEKEPPEARQPAEDSAAVTDSGQNPGNTEENKRFVRDNVGLEDPDTEKAVDDIVSEESDRILAIEDAKAELLAGGEVVVAEGFFARLKSSLAKFWSHTSVKVLTTFLVLGIFAAVAIFPQSRYFILNTLGVRASTSLTIIDDKTRQPLKDAEVSLQGQTAKSDKEGYVSFSEIKLGDSELVIKKPAFGAIVVNETFGWGSNPLGELQLSAVGSRYNFELTDFVSGKPIVKAEAISGQFSAVSDENGKLVLVVEDDSGKDVSIEIHAEGFRTEKLTMPAGSTDEKKLSMVPGRKHAFISKRDGTYDLFIAYVDGKGLKKILPGTGSEREDSLILVNHSDSNFAALVSTRGGQYGPSGNLLSVLTLVDVENDQATEIDGSESIQIIDFAGDKLIYVRQKENAKEDSASRYELVSYDVQTSEEKILASANYFNDVLLAQDAIYYSPAGVAKNSLGFFKINPDGSDKQTIMPKEAWNIFRVAYDKLHVAFSHEWYTYDLASSQLEKLQGAPATDKSRIYAVSPSGKRSLWVDERDGKGVLLLNNLETGKDEAIKTAGGLRNPVYWLDETHVIYRITTSSETADYILSTEGGEAKKVQDVTDTAGLDRWYLF